MSADRLAELAALGIKLWCEGDRLRCSAPQGVLTPGVAAELRACKAEILRVLGAAATSIDRVRDLPIPRAPHADTYRLSPPQRRYAADFGWAKAASWSTVVLQAPVPVRCDPAAFEAAFRIVCARHDCLRTVFPEVNGARRQLIRDEPALTFAHEHHDDLDATAVTARMAALRREASREQWNTHEGPLGKLVLVSHGSGEANSILLHFHRVMMDGTSVKLLIFELVRAVHELGAAAPTTRGDEIRYRDFSEWLNDLEQAGHFLGARDYWRQELAQPLPDPFGFNARGARGTTSADAGLAVREIPGAEVARLRTLAADRGWLFPMMLFAMYAISLREAGGGSELVIDASLSGRHRPELRACLGFLTNAAAIRIHLSPALTFSEVVDEITNKFAAAEEHQYFQYSDVIDDLGLDRETTLFPLSGILFNTITFDISAEQRSGARAPWQPLSTQARYGVMFYAMFHPECLSLELTHRLALMGEATATRILESYVRLVDRLISTGSQFSVGDALASQRTEP
jgi:hypothetical protein